MIRKFAKVHGLVRAMIALTILTGAAIAQSQQSTPSPSTGQQPSDQQAQPPASASQAGSSSSSSQEASPDEIPIRKPKPKDYKNWTFNVGAGASATNGTTTKYAKSGGAIGAAGFARNYSKYFSLRFDFQFDNLPLRNSALELAQATGASSHVYSFLGDLLVNIPVSEEWGGYILAGPAYYHRSGKLDSSTAIPGSACNGFYSWWGDCYHSTLPITGDFLKADENQLGENFGAGITRKITPKMELYAEFRYLHGSHSGVTTDLRPITIGVRF
jgi:hypothetical protein